MTSISRLHKTFAPFLVVTAIVAASGEAGAKPPSEPITAAERQAMEATPQANVETRAMAVIKPPVRVWTDPYRPAPPSFYEDQH